MGTSTVVLGQTVNSTEKGTFVLRKKLIWANLEIMLSMEWAGRNLQMGLSTMGSGKMGNPMELAHLSTFKRMPRMRETSIKGYDVDMELKKSQTSQPRMELGKTTSLMAKQGQSSLSPIRLFLRVHSVSFSKNQNRELFLNTVVGLKIICMMVKVNY